jgi:prepilin-type processing-associated H-X9-DG protein
MPSYSVWIRALGAVCLGLIGVSFLKRGFTTAYQIDLRTSCQSQMRELGLAFQMYAQDYDGRWPPRKTNRHSWGELIQASTDAPDRPGLFQCPSTSRGAHPSSDYWYNARLAKAPTKTVQFAARTIAMGEGWDNAARDTALSDLPASWLTNPNAPLWRHRKGANYAFADGHVKWYRATSAAKWQRTRTVSRPDAPTFAINAKTPQ